MTTCTYIGLIFYHFSVDVKSSSPPSTRVNALGFWMICCVVMVIAALSEYGLILIIKFKEKIPLQKINHMATSSDDITLQSLSLKRNDYNSKKISIYLILLNPTNVIWSKMLFILRSNLLKRLNY